MIKSKYFRFASILLPAALAAQPAQQARASSTQAPQAHYRAFDSKGNAIGLQEIVAALGEADVLFVGETHDDTVAHLLEAELLRRVDEGFGRASVRKRSVVVTIVRGEGFPQFDASALGRLGDFVIITDPAVSPRS